MGFKFTKDMFQRQDLGYWSYLNQNFELCLEPCLNGVDVAIYDHEKDLLEEKVCTDLPDMDDYELYGSIDDLNEKTWEKALEIANKLIRDYL